MTRRKPEGLSLWGNPQPDWESGQRQCHSYLSRSPPIGRHTSTLCGPLRAGPGDAQNRLELSLGGSYSLPYWTGPMSGTKAAPKSRLGREGNSVASWQLLLLEGRNPKGKRNMSNLPFPPHLPSVSFSFCPGEGNISGVEPTPVLPHRMSVSIHLLPPLPLVSPPQDNPHLVTMAATELRKLPGAPPPQHRRSLSEHPPDWVSWALHHHHSR